MYEMLREGQPVMVHTDELSIQGKVVHYYESHDGEEPNGYVVETKRGTFLVRTWELSLLADNGQDYE